MEGSPALRSVPDKSSSLIRFALTAGIFVGSFVVMPLTICGCHFHAAALVPTFLPLAWSLYLLHTSTGKSARILAWFLFLLAALWIYAGFFSNIVFLFR